MIEAIVKPGSWGVVRCVRGGSCWQLQNGEGLTGQEGRQAGAGWKPRPRQMQRERSGEKEWGRGA